MRSRISISTDAVEPALRSDFWREISRPLFQVSLLESPEPTLRGACISQPVGDLMIGAIRFNRQRYLRDRKTISASGMDSYLIQCLTSGSLRGDCDGRTIEADVGDICIFDLARPYVTEAEAGARITIVIPRTRIDAVIGHRSLHGLTLRASDPLTQMLRSVLLSLNDIASDIDEADALAAETTLIEVLITIVSHRLLGADQPRTPTTTALRARVEAFLDAHLTSPDLGVEALMREFDVSRTHLYRIFADKGAWRRPYVSAAWTPPSTDCDAQRPSTFRSRTSPSIWASPAAPSSPAPSAPVSPCRPARPGSTRTDPPPATRSCPCKATYGSD